MTTIQSAGLCCFAFGLWFTVLALALPRCKEDKFILGAGSVLMIVGLVLEASSWTV